MGAIKGTIVDAVSGEPVTAKVHVMSATGRSLRPPDAFPVRVGIVGCRGPHPSAASTLRGDPCPSLLATRLCPRERWEFAHPITASTLPFSGTVSWGGWLRAERKGAPPTPQGPPRQVRSGGARRRST